MHPPWKCDNLPRCIPKLRCRGVFLATLWALRLLPHLPQLAVDAIGPPSPIVGLHSERCAQPYEILWHRKPRYPRDIRRGEKSPNNRQTVHPPCVIGSPPWLPGSCGPKRRLHSLKRASNYRNVGKWPHLVTRRGNKKIFIME